jgi:hypothetical protein
MVGMIYIIMVRFIAGAVLYQLILSMEEIFHKNSSKN